MSALRLILGDQLSSSLATLADCAADDTILMCEVMQEARYVPHHPQKIAFIFAAMRHFAETLRAQGHRVRYVTLDDAANRGDLHGEVTRAITALKPQRLIVTEPGEWRLYTQFAEWQRTWELPVEIRRDDRFLCSHADFAEWAGDKKQLRMEFFYRQMRRRYTILMEGDKPVGGKWNYDAQNRKPPAAGMQVPKRPAHAPDAATSAVLKLVEAHFGAHFGSLERFAFAVTRDGAWQDARYFIDRLLPHFGDYQDAMVAGEPFLYHSRLSAYLNAGLLLPLELCELAEDAYRRGDAPLNAAEGFIRQILGWREYVRGIYWRHMPDYAELNALDAQRKLPALYWGGPTQMFCLSEAVRHTREHAYSHHIQRLMVTGNFALLAGLDPQAVCEWYLAVYADAYEWVELPNTLGMALFGDDGIMASKPYAASGKYINRMSNFCAQCAYNPNALTEEDACPFNALYWDFLARHAAHLRGNQRMALIYGTWDKMPADKKSAVRTKARHLLERLEEDAL